MKKIFGTDGVRGEYGFYPMDDITIVLLARAVCFWLKHHEKNPSIVIGQDPRYSGSIIQNLVTQECLKAGVNVIDVGVITTPALSFMVKNLNATLGVMISASHNLFMDNGIKLFKSDGSKLSDEQEDAIEKLLSVSTPKESVELGQYQIASYEEPYVNYLKSMFHEGLNLNGMKIALDCAHGSTYKIAPEILKFYGAKIVAIGVEPNGVNINEKVGSTSPEEICKMVKEKKCDLGIAFDGDGDRLLFIDKTGTLVDGDQIIAILADDFEKTVVATIMSNLGLERYFTQKGVGFIRTSVGDKNVYKAMVENGNALGGEQSGHIIMRDYSPTGDGLLVALHVLNKYVNAKDKTLFFKKFKPVPQKLISLSVKNTLFLQDENFKNEIDEISRNFADKGRVSVRKSGTENLVRVMVECEDEALLEKEMRHIISLISKR